MKEGRQENGMGVLLERRKKDGYWVAKTMLVTRIVLYVAEKGTTMGIK